MFPRSFEYFSPKTLRGALSLLQRYRDEAKILAGGHSLIPLMKLRLASPKYLIDINRVDGLSYIRENRLRILIGALTRHQEIERSKLVRDRCPLLSEAASVIGDPQVRNMGTIGGSLAHADPSGDFGTACLALDASVEVVGSKGKRVIPLNRFFKDIFTTALRPAEILTGISIPRPPSRSGGAYLKLERKAGDFATVAVAAQLTLDRNGSCDRARIGLGAVGDTPIRAARAEKTLRGKVITDSDIDDAAALAAQECSPSSDLRGSEEYKREMVRVFTRRGLRLAQNRARGGR